MTPEMEDLLFVQEAGKILAGEKHLRPYLRAVREVRASMRRLRREGVSEIEIHRRQTGGGGFALGHDLQAEIGVRLSVEALLRPAIGARARVLRDGRAIALLRQETAPLGPALAFAIHARALEDGRVVLVDARTGEIA